MSGHVYKRCTRPAQRGPDGRRLQLPALARSWTFVAWLPEEAASARQQHTKGGFTTKKDAEVALRAFLATIDTGQVVLPTKVTVGDYLAGWLEAVEPSLAPTAASNYRIIVRCYVLPYLGTRKMTGLRPDRRATCISCFRRLPRTPNTAGTRKTVGKK